MNFTLRGFPAFCFWMCCFLLSFWICDAFATRPLYIYVEKFRQHDMSDEQVLASAVQKAYDEAPNFWWLHSRKVALIFDQNRTYKLPPDLVENLYEKKKELPDVEFEIEAASLNPFK